MSRRANPFDDGIDAYPLQWPLGWARAPERRAARFNKKVTKQQDNVKRTWNDLSKTWVEAKETRSWKVSAKVTAGSARDFLFAELDRLGATHVVLSTNVPLRLDGGMKASASTERMEDPGAAVYFRLSGQPRVLATDKWDRLADNIHAIALHIEAMRGQGRWGVGDLNQAFTGYKQLAAAEAKKRWWEVLGFASEPATLEVADARWRRLIAKEHPDVGGSANKAAELNAAIQEARAIMDSGE
jgi:hypothetical protein